MECKAWDWQTKEGRVCCSSCGAKYKVDGEGQDKGSKKGGGGRWNHKKDKDEVTEQQQGEKSDDMAHDIEAVEQAVKEKGFQVPSKEMMKVVIGLLKGHGEEATDPEKEGTTEKLTYKDYGKLCTAAQSKLNDVLKKLQDKKESIVGPEDKLKQAKIDCENLEKELRIKASF